MEDQVTKPLTPINELLDSFVAAHGRPRKLEELTDLELLVEFERRHGDVSICVAKEDIPMCLFIGNRFKIIGIVSSCLKDLLDDNVEPVKHENT